LTITRPYLNCARHGRSSGDDRRPDIDWADRPPDGGSNDRRRYAWIDRKTPSTITENDSAIDHDGLANDYVTLARRQDH
jgi:hypothetical protein